MSASTGNQSSQLPSTAAPPLAPQLPPRIVSGNHLPDISDNSSDEDAAPPQSPATEKSTQLRNRLSELRNVAKSFADPSSSSDRKALKRLHDGAMELMDSAAAASPAPSPSTRDSRNPGRYTAMRIRRDKQRLEQQYLAAMSFLDRVDGNDAELVVEEPLEGDAASAAADQRQLQNYAREVNSFLEKAFNQDESVLVADEDEVPESAFIRSRVTRRRNPLEAFDSASIAHDKAELVRAAEEYGEYLNHVLDDETISQDADSQTDISETDSMHGRGLPNADSTKTLDDDVLSEADTDTEFDDLTLRLPPDNSQNDSSANLVGENAVQQRDLSTLAGNRSVDSNGSFPSQRGGPEHSNVSDSLPPAEAPVSPKVNILLTGSMGGGEKLEQVTLERTFFRKIPRGSTVQILPRAVKSGSQNAEVGNVGRGAAPPSAEELGRIKSERDALMGVLEEIVNERSMLAAQVGEMKQMIREHVRPGQAPVKEDDEEVNLADELQSAYDTIRGMTEETEDTIEFLQTKIQKVTAHKDQLMAENSDLELLVEDCKKEIKTLKNRLEGLEKKERNSSGIVEAAKRELYGKQSDALRNETRQAELKLELEKEKALLEDELNRHTEDNLRLIEELESAKKVNRDLSDSLKKNTDKLRDVEDESYAKMAGMKRQLQSAKTSIEGSMQDNELVREQLGKYKSMWSDSNMRNTQLEAETEQYRAKYKQLMTTNKELESDLKGMKIKYEESVKARAASVAQNIETAELQRRLADLQRESQARDELHRKQMHELKEMSNRAVAAAATAEQNAGQAANTATTAQENAKAQIEAERAARVAAESELKQKKLELDNMAREKHEWEKYAREKADGQRSGESAVFSQQSSRGHGFSGLVASGSRRGISGPGGANPNDQTRANQEQPAHRTESSSKSGTKSTTRRVISSLVASSSRRGISRKTAGGGAQASTARPGNGRVGTAQEQDSFSNLQGRNSKHVGSRDREDAGHSGSRPRRGLNEDEKRKAGRRRLFG